jgi:hypothetical protein
MNFFFEGLSPDPKNKSRILAVVSVSACLDRLLLPDPMAMRMTTAGPVQGFLLQGILTTPAGSPPQRAFKLAQHHG